MTVEALIRCRDALIDPEQREPPRSTHPRVIAADLKRWDGWVRTYLGVQSLMEPLRFQVSRDTAEKRAVSVYCVDLDSVLADDVAASVRSNVAGTVQPLVGLRRPLRAVFASQIGKVLDWAELRSDRSPEILAQIENQYAFWGAIVPIDNGRMPRTLDLVEVVIQFAVFVESRFKHELNCARPAEFSAQVQPLITTPGHGSFPSGHGTQAYATAHVLAALLGAQAGDLRHTQLQRLAARIATNRVVAGVHFPVDSLAGRLLGQTLGEYVMARCAQGSWLPRYFDGAQTEALKASDFNPFAQSLDVDAPDVYHRISDQEQTVSAPSTILQALWRGAWDECAHLRPGPL